MALLAVAGVVPSWAAPQQHLPSVSTTVVAQSKPRTAADLPKPPKAMTLADRRKQVTKTRLDRSPISDFMKAPGRKPTSKPARPDGHGAKRGPAAKSSNAVRPRVAAAPENPTWVSSSATAYPGLLSIGGHVKLPKRGSSYTGMWFYVLDEAGNFVIQQEIKKSTDDPSSDTPATGAWCYDWWSSNSYPTDECF